MTRNRMKWMKSMKSMNNWNKWNEALIQKPNFLLFATLGLVFMFSVTVPYTFDKTHISVYHYAKKANNFNEMLTLETWCKNQIFEGQTWPFVHPLAKETRVFR